MSDLAGLFGSFEQHDVPTARGSIRAMVGGTGPPVLLLHGYPESLLMWHAVAPLLAGATPSSRLTSPATARRSGPWRRLITSRTPSVR